MSTEKFDIIAKIRSLLGFGPNAEETTLKRRNNSSPDYPIVSKYRRVSNEFPKIIKKPFEDDIRPQYRERIRMAQRRSEVNGSGFINSKYGIYNRNIPRFADIEFSDDEEDPALLFQQRTPLATSSFNVASSSTIKPRRSLLIEENNKQNPREINIPIKIEKPLPNLLKARSSGLLPSSCIPNLQPINKNKYNDNVTPVEYTNGFGNSISYGRKNDPGHNTPMINNRKTTTIKSTKPSMISRLFNLEERDNYKNLLATILPSLYNTNLNNRNASSVLDKKENIASKIDLTDTKIGKKKARIEAIIHLDDDDETSPKDIIDLADDDVQIIAACEKLNKRNYKEPPSRKELPQVEPVNTLKDKLDLTPTLQPQWLERFREKHEEKSRLRKKQIEEEEENVRKLAVETEKQERLIEKRLKDVKIDVETIILDESEPEEEEIEFPALTEEQNTVIKRSIYQGSSDEVLISKFNLRITRRDICTLAGDSWLNDEVINFYMNLLIERGEQRNSEGLPRVYAMNTFFIPRLMQSGHSGVKRWTRKVNIFSYDIIPVPVHVGGVHWCMAIIHLQKKTIKYYDSMGTPNPRILQMLEQYLQDESLDKKKQYFDTSDFIKESVKDVPRQMNGSDCGVFSCMFAEYISRNKEITFSQQHMPYFRQKMIYEIVQGKLLL